MIGQRLIIPESPRKRAAGADSSGAETEFKESVEMKQISQRQMLESYFQPLTPVCLTCEPYACELKK